MRSISKLTSVAGLAVIAAVAVAAPAMARQDVKPAVTGVGFADSQAGATGLAIRAWTNTARQKYGAAFDDYNKSQSRTLSCERIGAAPKGGFAAKGHRSAPSIGVEGNPNGRFTCTTSARPVGHVASNEPNTQNATGIGFGTNRQEARWKAVEAWRSSVRAAYGPAFDKFFVAKRKNVSCDFVGQAKGFSANRSAGRIPQVETRGNPSKAWTCTATGEPRTLFGRLY